MKTNLYLLALVLLAACAPKVKAPEPYGAIPSEHQLEWQKMEYYMFIHFGPNTFTDVEWGHGKEDPKVFNPTNLDVKQWARTAKLAGMKAIIITAKHHDGFCLWPSEYSTHTVRESLWKEGKGDLLKELSEACKDEGLKFGVYLSPWDQNHPDYGTEKYNQIFANQLTEVSENYGHIFEQWFDGACGEGPNGKKQVYDWDLFHKTVYGLQAHSIIFSDVGPGCRWMGNERGISGETNWSTLNVKGFGPGADGPSRESLNQGDMNAENWIPAEVDVSIRPGWFYSPSTNDRVKSLNHMVDIYHTSIGRNSNLLLNVPPSREGKIHINDSIRLMELKSYIDKSFAENLAKGMDIKASNTRDGFTTKNLLDGNFDTYWATDDNVLTASLELDLKQEKTFNRLLLQEYIALGQRIKSFTVEYWENDQWKSLAEQTTVGYKRILRFPSVTTSKLRINIEALACITLSEIEIYNASEIIPEPQMSRNREGLVSIKSVVEGGDIYYTTDGSEPSTKSKKYTNQFYFEGGYIKARISKNDVLGETKSLKCNYISKDWKLVDNVNATAIIDANKDTYSTISSSVTIDLSKQISISGFNYLPVDNRKNINLKNICNIVDYNFYCSKDGHIWDKVSEGKFNNMENNPVLQEVKFATIEAKYIKLEVLNSTCNNTQMSISEIEIVSQ